MSDTPGNPTAENPAVEPAAADAAGTDGSAAPPPPAATVSRGLWKYLGAGAVGLVVGVLLTGAVAWAVGDGGGKDSKDHRPAMSQRDDRGGKGGDGKRGGRAPQDDRQGGRGPGQEQGPGGRRMVPQAPDGTAPSVPPTTTPSVSPGA